MTKKTDTHEPAGRPVQPPRVGGGDPVTGTDERSASILHYAEHPLIPAEPLPAAELKTIDAIAKERGTPDWLVAALKHQFRNRETVTAAEFDAAAENIANHPIGGRR